MDRRYEFVLIVSDPHVEMTVKNRLDVDEGNTFNSKLLLFSHSLIATMPSVVTGS